MSTTPPSNHVRQVVDLLRIEALTGRQLVDRTGRNEDEVADVLEFLAEASMVTSRDGRWQLLDGVDSAPVSKAPASSTSGARTVAAGLLPTRITTNHRPHSGTLEGAR